MQHGHPEYGRKLKRNDQSSASIRHRPHRSSQIVTERDAEKFQKNTTADEGVATIACEPMVDPGDDTFRILPLIKTKKSIYNNHVDECEIGPNPPSEISGLSSHLENVSRWTVLKSGLPKSARNKTFQALIFASDIHLLKYSYDFDSATRLGEEGIEWDQRRSLATYPNPDA